MQNGSLSKPVVRLLVITAVIASLAFIGCGGDNNNGPISNGFIVAADQQAAAAANNTEFVFPNGVAEFGTTDDTTVTFINNGANATVANVDGESAEADASFGSCIFTFTNLDFDGNGTPFPDLPAVVTITPDCDFEITSDADIGGAAAPGTVVLVLNGVASNAVDIDAVEIDENGNLFVDNVDTGGNVPTGTGGS